jgi:hypothetical protein
MTAAQLRRVAIALVVAVFLWGIVEILARRGDTVEEVPLIPAIVGDEVDAVVIRSAQDTIRLERSGDGTWRVNGFATAPDAVTALLDALGEPTAGELVAQNPSSHERMGVGRSSATHVTVRRGDRVLGEVLMGAQGRSFRSAYMRRPGQDDVYLVEGELVPLVGRDVNEWRDKRIVVVEPDSIGGIDVERGRMRYTLERQDSVWSLAYGGAVDSARVERLVQAFRTVEAQGEAFATPAQADSTDFTRPERRVRLVGTDGTELATLAFDSTETGFWVLRDGRETIYLLNRWKVDDLTPTDSAVRRKE